MKFSKYGGKVSFVVNGETIEINRIKTEKIQQLMNYAQDDKTVLINMVDFFVKLIMKNYPEEKEEEVLAFVQQNTMKIMEEFQIAYGLASREDLDKAKEEAKKKTQEDTDEKVKQV